MSLISPHPVYTIERKFVVLVENDCSSARRAIDL